MSAMASDSSDNPALFSGDEAKASPTIATAKSSPVEGNGYVDENELTDNERPLENDEDLFGHVVDDDDDDDDGAQQTLAERSLDDERLDSGDDLDRDDRVKSHDAGDFERMEVLVASASLTRHLVPESSDNELYLMTVPHFLAIEPRAFVLQKWQPPTTDHHSTGEPSHTFSPFETAQTTIRWRRSPSDPSKLQSNARILRWSDGSLTLQLASDPLTQYELDGKPLAPPQTNPAKPTPTSIHDATKSKKVLHDTAKDTFHYLCALNAREQIVRVTDKITVGLSVMPSKGMPDDSVERLRQSMAAAAKARPGTSGLVSIFHLEEDPEKKKKEAEAAEKERERQAKHEERLKERQRMRIDLASGRSALGRSVGYSGSRYGLLNSYGDDHRGTRGPKQRRSRREVYSDEDDDTAPRSRFKEDEYDEEDDFVARSDEEPETYEDDEEIDEDIDERIETQQHRERKASPKRAHADNGEEDEAVASGFRKRRRVIDDDDDDE